MSCPFRKNLAAEWMRQDSPWTPKRIIADAERSSLKVVIDEKVTKMESALKAYSTRGRGSSEMRKLVFRMQKMYMYCQRQFL